MKPYQSLPELMARGRLPDERRTTTPVPPDPAEARGAV